MRTHDEAYYRPERHHTLTTNSTSYLQIITLLPASRKARQLLPYGT